MPIFVNNEEIDPELIEDEFSKVKSYYEQMLQVSCCERDAEFREKAKENIIERVLLAQESEVRDIQVDAAEIEEELQKMIDTPEMQERLRTYGDLNEDEKEHLRENLRFQLRYEKFLKEVCGEDVEPTKEELMEFYEENVEDYLTIEEVRVCHLFKSLRNAEDANVVFDWLKDIRRSALDGEDFEKLAREHGDRDDSDEKHDVDLGFIKREQKYMDEFECIVFSLHKGEISPVFRSHLGFHIVKAVDRRPAVPKPFKEVKEDIQERYILETRQKKMKGLISRLREKANVRETEEEAVC